MNKANIADIDDWVNTIGEYTTATGTFINQVVDPDTGILVGVQCGFIKDTILRFEEALCVSTITSLWKVEFLLAVMTSAMLIGACCSFCAGSR